MATKPTNKTVSKKLTEEETFKTNRIQLLAPIGRLIVRAEVTISGNAYEWRGCGSIVEVDERDVGIIFKIRSGFQPCASCHDGDSNMFMVLD